MSWFKTKQEPGLAEQVEWNFKVLRGASLQSPKQLSVESIKDQIEKLHTETRRIKREGVSVWNAKAVIPRIFDVVDGAFVTMKEVVQKIEELEAKISESEKK